MPLHKADHVTPLAQRAYAMICEQPGISQYDLAVALGRGRNSVDALLATVERAGLLVAQEGSRLWPFQE